jgi:hypothetical protein
MTMRRRQTRRRLPSDPMPPSHGGPRKYRENKRVWVRGPHRRRKLSSALPLSFLFSIGHVLSLWILRARNLRWTSMVALTMNFAVRATFFFWWCCLGGA